MIITPKNQEIELLPEHAIYLPAHKALVLADVHLGKAATFRSHGLAVPEGDNEADLNRIDLLLKKHQAEHLIIAGDLLHSPTGLTAELQDRLSTWLENCPAQVTLILGNHDQRALPKTHQLPLTTTPSLEFGDLQIIHDPAESSKNVFSICGHIHPVISIKDGQRSSIRTPCFHLTESSLTLPSFGTFTGGQPISPSKNHQVFIPLKNHVREVPPAHWASY